MIRRLILAIVGGGLMVASCDMRVNNPESVDYPCGPLGVVCSGSYPNATCCWQGDVCGTADQGVDSGPFVGCPAGYCCWVGNDNASNASGVFDHKPYLQIKGR